MVTTLHGTRARSRSCAKYVVLPQVSPCSHGAVSRFLAWLFFVSIFLSIVSFVVYGLLEKEKRRLAGYAEEGLLR
jgi:hypothetical protein